MQKPNTKKFTGLNDIFYVSAAVVTKRLVKKRKERAKHPWRSRIKWNVHEIQQDLSIVKETMNRRYDDRMRRKMEKRFDNERRGYQQVLEELKHRQIAFAAKINIFDGRVKQYQQSRLLENKQKRFCDEIQSKQIGEYEIPDDEESKSFQMGIWEKRTEYIQRYSMDGMSSAEVSKKNTK